MPPKLRRPAGVLGAAAKAGPKAKAAGRPKARPRGAAGVRIRRDRRRPAADIREPGEEVEEVFSREDFLRGVEVNAADIPFTELKKGVKIVVTEATYWEEPVKVAGLLEKVESDGESKTICLNLLGTTSESLVKWKGKFPGQVLAVHLCHKDCGRLSKDGLLHCDRLRVGKVEAEEPWMQNLAGMDPHPKEDEMEALRRRAEKVGTGEDAPGDGKRKSESSGSEGSSREKKTKKKKKKKKKNHKGSKEKKKVNGTKGLAEVFGTTGLDPDPDVRKKALRRGKKIAKKKVDLKQPELRGEQRERGGRILRDLWPGGQGEVHLVEDTRSFDRSDSSTDAIFFGPANGPAMGTGQEVIAPNIYPILEGSAGWESNSSDVPRNAYPVVHRGSSSTRASSSGLRRSHSEAKGFRTSGWRRRFPGGSAARTGTVRSPDDVVSYRDHGGIKVATRRPEGEGSSFRKRLLGPKQIKRRLRLLGERKEQKGRLCEGQRQRAERRWKEGRWQNWARGARKERRMRKEKKECGIEAMGEKAVSPKSSGSCLGWFVPSHSLTGGQDVALSLVDVSSTLTGEASGEGGLHEDWKGDGKGCLLEEGQQDPGREPAMELEDGVSCHDFLAKEAGRVGVKEFLRSQLAGRSLGDVSQLLCTLFDEARVKCCFKHNKVKHSGGIFPLPETFAGVGEL